MEFKSLFNVDREAMNYKHLLFTIDLLSSHAEQDHLKAKLKRSLASNVAIKCPPPRDQITHYLW